MSKITSIIGLVLISAAGIIVALSTSYADVIKAKKELSSKYINKAKTELENKNYGKAEEFAKLAIKADPENKQAYEVIVDITKATVAPVAKTEEKKEAPKPKKISIDLGC
jgi:Tfp pilus assembly protein PilF